MRTLFWAGTLVGLAVWVVSLQRRLRSAEARGNMYRDAAVRLDRKLSGQVG